MTKYTKIAIIYEEHNKYIEAFLNITKKEYWLDEQLIVFIHRYPNLLVTCFTMIEHEEKINIDVCWCDWLVG